MPKMIKHSFKVTFDFGEFQTAAFIGEIELPEETLNLLKAKTGDEMNTLASLDKVSTAKALGSFMSTLEFDGNDFIDEAAASFISDAVFEETVDEKPRIELRTEGMVGDVLVGLFGRGACFYTTNAKVDAFVADLCKKLNWPADCVVDLRTTEKEAA